MSSFALAIGAAGVLVAVAAWVRTHQPALALGIALDLWVAAGLLRLSEDASWGATAGAATLIVVRKLVVSALGPRPSRGEVLRARTTS